MPVDTQEPPKSAQSLPSRLVGILVSPRQTYQGVVAHPRWFGMLATVMVVSAVGLFAFLSTQVGQQAMLDQQIKQAEMRGVEMSEAAIERTERILP
jgi:hypothetical protein